MLVRRALLLPLLSAWLLPSGPMTMRCLVGLALIAQLWTGCKPSDPGDLLLYHMEKVVDLMGANLDDCAAAADKIVAYWEKNRDDLREIGSRQTEMIRTLPQAEKVAYARRFKERYARLVQGTMATAREFDRRCGHLAGKYRKVMTSMQLPL